MSHTILKVVLAAFLFVNITGCASVPATGPKHEFVDTQSDSKNMRMIWTIGAILVVGALLLNETEDGVKDSIRQISTP